MIFQSKQRFSFSDRHFQAASKTRFVLICGRFKPIIRSGLFLPETTL
ncbi:hypothetical protein HMPREF9370_2506 [Neisseria wadsworthii 9715]|uniref:Uncharacterized protein n=1 Tax=Neisseria wadsworthii 9715 TaxID=1030841 RepID=G4CTU6_9NEIS|nr:hypothetical protein HMPREF9370_2506 [Neisseria wadsworthii 9715]